MRIESVDMTGQNIDKIASLFQNCVAETVKNSQPKQTNNYSKLPIMFMTRKLDKLIAC